MHSMAKRISATELAKKTADILDRVAFKGERFVVKRRGKAICRILPVKRRGCSGADLAEAREYLKLLVREADRLEATVSDMHYFTHPVEVRAQRVYAAALVRDVARELTAAGAKVRVEAAGELPVSADPRLLTQALLNLGRNAHEAAPGGEITLTARRDAAAVVLEVDDAGPGLPDEVMENLFRPFVTTKSRGLGLGLAITKRIVDAHGGTLTAASHPDRGCRFAVRLAVAP